MFEVNCIDAYGETISALTQWDTNQSIIIEDCGFESAPIFHFCNKLSERALGVQSVLNKTNGKLTVDIPNSLLREPYPITVYIYLYKNKENPEGNHGQDIRGKTVEIINIPIRPRLQPTDYEYSDNINVVYIEDLIAEVHQFHDEVNAAEKIRISNENTRIFNENQRITNETQRQVSTSAAIQACKEQTSECTQATNDTLEAKKTVDDLLYDIDGGNAYTNPAYMFQIDGGNCESE